MELKKRFFFLLLFSVLCILVILLILISRPSKVPLGFRDYPEIISSGMINVVTDYNTIGYYVSSDSAEGFQLEMIKALEKEWGIKVNLFLENSLDENLEGLLSLRYDLVARNIPVNVHLRDTFAFTDPITLNKQVLVQRKAAFNNNIEPIRQHLNLAKKIVYVAKDSPVILRLNNLAHEIGDTIIIKEDQTYEVEQLVMMVASGDIDFTVCDEKVATLLAKALPEIDIDTDISFTQLESWAVRRDSPVLLDSLNSWLGRFKTTKKYNQILDKYYLKINR